MAAHPRNGLQLYTVGKHPLSKDSCVKTDRYFPIEWQNLTLYTNRASGQTRFKLDQESVDVLLKYNKYLSSELALRIQCGKAPFLPAVLASPRMPQLLPPLSSEPAHRVNVWVDSNAPLRFSLPLETSNPTTQTVASHRSLISTEPSRLVVPRHNNLNTHNSLGRRPSLSHPTCHRVHTHDLRRLASSQSRYLEGDDIEQQRCLLPQSQASNMHYTVPGSFSPQPSDSSADTVFTIMILLTFAATLGGAGYGIYQLVQLIGRTIRGLKDGSEWTMMFRSLLLSKERTFQSWTIPPRILSIYSTQKENIQNMWKYWWS